MSRGKTAVAPPRRRAGKRFPMLAGGCSAPPSGMRSPWSTYPAARSPRFWESPRRRCPTGWLASGYPTPIPSSPSSASSGAPPANSPAISATCRPKPIRRPRTWWRPSRPADCPASRRSASSTSTSSSATTRRRMPGWPPNSRRPPSRSESSVAAGRLLRTELLVRPPDPSEELLDLAFAPHQFGVAIELEGLDPRHDPPAGLLMAGPPRRPFQEDVVIQDGPAADIVQAADDEFHRRPGPFPPAGVWLLLVLDELRDHALEHPESFL